MFLLRNCHLKLPNFSLSWYQFIKKQRLRRMKIFFLLISNLDCKGGRGRTIQDNIDITTLTKNPFEVNNCSACKHKFLLPIGMNTHEIIRVNQKVSKEHLTKMQIWSNMPVQKKGAKPWPGKLMSRHLVCMCTKMSCINQINGAGCFKYETACAHAVEQGSDARLLFDRNFQCACVIYKHECSVVYFRHEKKIWCNKDRLKTRRIAMHWSNRSCIVFWGSPRR